MLGITQPAVSRALALLESDVGELLFDRGTMLPTAFGKIVLKHGAQVVNSFSDLSREITLLKGLEVGELVVAMGPYPAAISGQAAAALLSNEHPRLSIDLRVMNWVDAVEAAKGGHVDLAFADLSEAEGSADLDVRPVRRGAVTFFCRAGHPLPSRPGLTLSDCLDFPWVGPVVPGRVGRSLPAADKPYGCFDPVNQRFEPRIVTETFQAMTEMAMASDALAAALPFMVAAEISTGRLAPLIKAPFLTLNYGFIWRKARTLSPATRAYMDAVLKIESQLPPQPIDEIEI
ncbi:LysR family transcriptional regulator [Alsobacter metallidurans]|uniref:LysR family transcriptional regulator n=1 Tax=Alsobacter metallidurans TaxID=340221 RepID=A0A917IBC0_9HYPH|nr:LysR family transcriptional regulator [Alsobacter metallidurans]